MKVKTTLLATIILIPLCTLLRTLQYFFVTDRDGYFRADSAGDTVLIWAFRVLLLAAALYALTLLLAGDRAPITPRPLSHNAPGILLTLAGLLLLTDGGIAVGNMIRQGTVQFAAFLELLCAVYFCVAGFHLMSGKRYGTFAMLLGLSPTVYFIVYAIGRFFSDFQRIHVSKVKLDMLTLCALILFLLTLTSVYAGVAVKTRRLQATAAVYAVLAASSTLPEIITLSLGRATVDAPLEFWIHCCLHLLLGAAAVTVLFLASKTENTEPAEE